MATISRLYVPATVLHDAAGAATQTGYISAGHQYYCIVFLSLTILIGLGIDFID